jgi:hypothetical protein
MKAPEAAHALVRGLCRVGAVAMTCVALFATPILTGEARACATNLALDGPLDRIFELRLQDGKIPVEMRAVRVVEGDMVHLRWTSDRRFVLHLDGYDMEKTVEPGAVAEFAFVADVTGRFAITVVGEGAASDRAPPVYLEVYPR